MRLVATARPLAGADIRTRRYWGDENLRGGGGDRRSRGRRGAVGGDFGAAARVRRSPLGISTSNAREIAAALRRGVRHGRLSRGRARRLIRGEERGAKKEDAIRLTSRGSAPSHRAS